jgi:hypothetical protein
MIPSKAEIARALQAVVERELREAGITKRQFARRLGPNITKSQNKALARIFLIELRGDYGLTQRQLSEKCKRTPSWVAKMEVGERILTLQDIFGPSAQR